MPFVVAALVLLGLVCLANLGLTFGLIKRLRDAAEPALAIGPGDRPAPFVVSTLDGARVTPETVAGRLVGFLAAGCPPCRDTLPAFVAHLHRSPSALAVVIGSGTEVDELVDPLRDLVPIVVEPPRGPMAEAFRATGFPSFYRVDHTGTVMASGRDWAALPAPARERE